jgi:NADPH:quinone reductase-like Zn-dependent oxidoreductase
MSNRASIVGTGLRRRPLEDKAMAVQAFAREVVPLLASGCVRPYLDACFPHTEAARAFARLDSPGKRGKVLLSFNGSHR